MRMTNLINKSKWSPKNHHLITKRNLRRGSARGERKYK